MRRCLMIAGVAMMLLVTSGCVYLRLLALRDQLRTFDDHFTVEQHERLTIIAREPVLEVGDLTWLLGSAPTSQSDGPPPRCCWRFTKLPTPGDPPGLPGRELVLETTANNGLVERVTLPEAITRAIAPELIIRLLRALGTATIDRAQRTANATLAPLPQPALVPTRAELIGLFGIPNRPAKVNAKDIELMSYGYRVEPPPALPDSKPVPAAEAVVLFGFKPGADRPYLFLFSSAGNWVSIDLRTDPPKP